MGCIGGRCRQALVSPVPPAKRSPSSRPAPKLGAYRALIDAWLRPIARRRASSATRRSGSGGGWSTSTAPRSLRRRSATMCVRASARSGWPVGEVFVPQVHAPGEWRRSTGARRRSSWLASRTTVHLFVMRAGRSPRSKLEEAGSSCTLLGIVAAELVMLAAYSAADAGYRRSDADDLRVAECPVLCSDPSMRYVDEPVATIRLQADGPARSGSSASASARGHHRQTTRPTALDAAWHGPGDHGPRQRRRRRRRR